MNHVLHIPYIIHYYARIRGLLWHLIRRITVSIKHMCHLLLLMTVPLYTNALYKKKQKTKQNRYKQEMNTHAFLLSLNLYFL